MNLVDLVFCGHCELPDFDRLDELLRIVVLIRDVQFGSLDALGAGLVRFTETLSEGFTFQFGLYCDTGF